MAASLGCPVWIEHDGDEGPIAFFRSRKEALAQIDIIIQDAELRSRKEGCSAVSRYYVKRADFTIHAIKFTGISKNRCRKIIEASYGDPNFVANNPELYASCGKTWLRRHGAKT